MTERALPAEPIHASTLVALTCLPDRALPRRKRQAKPSLPCRTVLWTATDSRAWPALRYRDVTSDDGP